MPLYDEHGNEVEGALSQEEVDKKIEETKAAHEEENAKTKEEGEKKVEELQKEAAEAKAALELANKSGAGGDKGGDSGDKSKEDNLSELRKKLDETEKALEEQKTSNDDRWNKATGETFDQALQAVAAEDEDLKEKIKHHYETTLSGVKAETPTEVREKVANALRLAAKPGTVINPMDVALQGSGGPGIKPADSGEKVEIKPEEREFGKKLGLNDADYEKYANDPRLKKK